MNEKLLNDNNTNQKIKYTLTNKSAAHNEREDNEQIETTKIKSNKKRKVNYEVDFKNDFSKTVKIESEYNTLNESVCQTLKRDLMRIWNKLSVVIIPISNQEKDNELRHWDLWGPFLFCILLGL